MLAMFNLYTIFAVPCFTSSKVNEGSQTLKRRSHEHDHIPFLDPDPDQLPAKCNRLLFVSSKDLMNEHIHIFLS